MPCSQPWHSARHLYQPTVRVRKGQTRHDREGPLWVGKLLLGRPDANVRCSVPIAQTCCSPSAGPAHSQSGFRQGSDVRSWQDCRRFAALAGDGGFVPNSAAGVDQIPIPRFRPKLQSTAPQTAITPVTCLPSCGSNAGRHGTSWKPIPSSIMANRPEDSVTRWR